MSGNHTAIVYGTSMALVDVVVLSMLKAKAIGLLDGKLVLLGAMMVYAFQPFIFLQSLKSESLTVMNLFWDLASDVLVSLTGIFIFKEQLSFRKWLGVGLAFVSLCLMGC